MPRPDKRENRCTTCGCTESAPCLVERGAATRGCSWILLDQVKHEGLCSECASLPQYVYALLPVPDPMGPSEALVAFGLTVRELSEHTGRAAKVIRRALNRMRDRGLARSDRTPSNALAWY